MPLSCRGDGSISCCACWVEMPLAGHKKNGWFAVRGFHEYIVWMIPVNACDDLLLSFAFSSFSSFGFRTDYRKTRPTLFPTPSRQAAYPAKSGISIHSPLNELRHMPIFFSLFCFSHCGSCLSLPPFPCSFSVLPTTFLLAPFFLLCLFFPFLYLPLPFLFIPLESFSHPFSTPVIALVPLFFFIS